MSTSTLKLARQTYVDGATPGEIMEVSISPLRKLGENSRAAFISMAAYRTSPDISLTSTEMKVRPPNGLNGYSVEMLQTIQDYTGSLVRLPLDWARG